MTSSEAAMTRSRGRELARSARTLRTGVWLLLAGIVMLFAAFTSAMVVRKGASNDWVKIALPRVFLVAAWMLLAVSFFMEAVRWLLRKTPSAQASTGQRGSIAFLLAAMLCGFSVLGYLWQGLQQLSVRGMHIAANPAIAFVYVFTIAYAVHLVGAMLAIAGLARRFIRSGAAALGRQDHALDAVAIYCHAMVVLWIYILVVLTVQP